MISMEIEEMFEGIAQDVTHLHVKVKLYYQVFGKSYIQDDLLDRAAGLLFTHLGHSLFNDILLSVSRLNDPGTSGNGKKLRHNWNIESLLRMVEADIKESEDMANLHAIHESIKAWRGYFKDTRDRFLAHRDWDRRTNEILKVAEPHLQVVLERYAEFLNAIEHHYKLTTTYYDQINTKLEGDGDSLFRCLVMWAKTTDQKLPEYAKSWDQALADEEN